MHARTKINAAEILSLLYHSTPSCGIFNLKKKPQKYHASQDGGVFKKFEKKIRTLPRNLELWGIIRTKISSLLRVPRNSKWSGTKKSEKVGHLYNFFEKVW